MNTSISKKNTQRLHNTRQKGISTVQVAIGIMVSVIILLGAIGGYQYVNQGKVNNEISAINDLKVATVKYGATYGTLAGLTMTQLNTFGFFNNPVLTYNSTGSTVTSQWGGNVSFTGTASGLEVSFVGVPQSACLDLIGKVDSIVDTMNLNTTQVKAPGASASMTLATTTNCPNAGQTIKYFLTK